MAARLNLYPSRSNLWIGFVLGLFGAVCGTFLLMRMPNGWLLALLPYSGTAICIWALATGQAPWKPRPRFSLTAQGLLLAQYHREPIPLSSIESVQAFDRPNFLVDPPREQGIDIICRGQLHLSGWGARHVALSYQTPTPAHSCIHFNTLELEVDPEDLAKAMNSVLNAAPEARNEVIGRLSRQF